MRFLRNGRGFTLIEIIMIVVMLAVLVAVAVPGVIALQNEATVSNNLAYINSLRSVLSMRFAEQVLHEGTPDVIGSTPLEAPVTVADIQALRKSPEVPEASLVTTPGACGIGAWTGLQPGNPPVLGTWNLECGASPTDPIRISGP